MEKIKCLKSAILKDLELLQAGLSEKINQIYDTSFNVIFYNLL